MKIITHSPKLYSLWPRHNEDLLCMIYTYSVVFNPATFLVPVPFQESVWLYTGYIDFDSTFFDFPIGFFNLFSQGKKSTYKL